MFGLLAGPLSPPASSRLTASTASAIVRSGIFFSLISRVASHACCTKSQMWYLPMSLNDLKPCSSTRESAVHNCPRTNTAISLFVWSLPSWSALTMPELTCATGARPRLEDVHADAPQLVLERETPLARRLSAVGLSGCRVVGCLCCRLLFIVCWRPLSADAGCCGGRYLPSRLPEMSFERGRRLAQHLECIRRRGLRGDGGPPWLRLAGRDAGPPAAHDRVRGPLQRRRLHLRGARGGEPEQFSDAPPFASGDPHGGAARPSLHRGDRGGALRAPGERLVVWRRRRRLRLIGRIGVELLFRGLELRLERLNALSQRRQLGDCFLHLC
mmetsp:Transcript_47068/g.100476  ORF Transcript_47068/g.100476 Transcript_47068/m.100476 type:complete len:328 (+) Transcript_47068:805-1788(+)